MKHLTSLSSHLLVVASCSMFACNLSEPGIDLPGDTTAADMPVLADMPALDMNQAKDAFMPLPDMPKQSGEDLPAMADMADMSDLQVDMFPDSLISQSPCFADTNASPEDRFLCVTTPDHFQEQVLVNTGFGSEPDLTFLATTDANRFVFESKILDLGSAHNIKEVSWAQNTPFGLALPLPSNGAQITNEKTIYGNSGTSLDEIQSLFRFATVDFTSLISMAVAVKDQSGLSGKRDLLYTDSKSSSYKLVDSPLGKALDLSRSEYFETSADAEAIQLKSKPFTMGAWAKHDDVIAQNRVIFGGQDTRKEPGLFSQAWFGYGDGMSTTGSCRGVPTGAARMTLISRDEKSVTLCGSKSLNDGKWHHIAMTRDDVRHRLFVDGRVVAAVELAGKPLIFNRSPDAYPFRVGSFAQNEERRSIYDTAVTVDELAVWHRALSTEEMRAWYDRAITQVSISVQRCDSPMSCDGQDWEPLNLTKSTTPSTTRRATVSPMAAATSTRYFRYQVIVESSAEPKVAPGIKWMEWRFESAE